MTDKLAGQMGKGNGGKGGRRGGKRQRPNNGGGGNSGGNKKGNEKGDSKFNDKVPAPPNNGGKSAGKGAWAKRARKNIQGGKK